jgi:hypothetical protein
VCLPKIWGQLARLTGLGGYRFSTPATPSLSLWRIESFPDPPASGPDRPGLQAGTNLVKAVQTLILAG